ncbi:hypothetical protein AB0K48_23815 [Nonomuraea sp. NPDC055795]
MRPTPLPSAPARCGPASASGPVTKTFTAAVVLRLAAEGRIDLIKQVAPRVLCALNEREAERG